MLVDSCENIEIGESLIEQLVGELTLEEKIAMVHASTKFTTPSIDRLGIPGLSMADGPHGVREEIEADSWLPAGRNDDYATYLPVGMAVAATWNPKMAALHGHVLGAEARARGKDVILGPGVNMMRTPLCGRNFEYLGEDPYLASRIAVGEIRAIQSEGLAACVKHYALNNQELDRHGVDIEVDERTLHEIYLPVFRAAVIEAGVLTVMGAYNLFRGQYCCHNKYLINTILKGRWNFKGLVVSDWAGTEDTYEAACYGLDVEMGTGKPYDQYHLGEPYLREIRAGRISESTLDDKVRRILRVLQAIGAFDPNRKKGSLVTPEHDEACRDIAREAVVLLKNENNILPLDLSRINRIAVIGRNAVAMHGLDGGSSGVKTPSETSPLQGLEEALGGSVQFEYVQGYPARLCPGEIISTEYLNPLDGSGTRGWKVDIFSRSDEGGLRKVCQRIIAEIHLKWSRKQGIFNFCGVERRMRFYASVNLPDTGVYELFIEGNGLLELWANGKQLDLTHSAETPGVYTAEMTGSAGQTVELELDYQPSDPEAGGVLELGWLRPGQTRNQWDDDQIRALEVAKKADVVLFFSGLSHSDESEGFDRRNLLLPHDQDALIESILEVNRNMVVVNISGAPVEMPWAPRVAAIVQGWYLGSQGGKSIADVLTGKVNPCGKLPCTFPKSLSDTPAAQCGEYQVKHCVYREGPLIGYRWFDTKKIDPLFCFGHGLSYTQFSYSDLQIHRFDGVVQVDLTLTNIGERSGAEVVQLYVSDIESSLPRPVKELRGFRKVFLAAGQKAQVRMRLTTDDLAYYDNRVGQWVFEPGEYRVLVGSSSRDIRLEGSFVW